MRNFLRFCDVDLVILAAIGVIYVVNRALDLYYAIRFLHKGKQ